MDYHDDLEYRVGLERVQEEEKNKEDKKELERGEFQKKKNKEDGEEPEEEELLNIDLIPDHEKDPDGFIRFLYRWS